MEFVQQLKTSLEDYQMLKDIEEKTKIPKEQIVIGGSSCVFLVVFFGVGMPLVCNLIGFVPPLFLSLRSLEQMQQATVSERNHQMKLWLSYWVIFGLFGVLETFVHIILKIFPFYYALKVAILIWCMSPTWRGSSFIFETLLENAKFLQPNTSVPPPSPNTPPPPPN